MADITVDRIIPFAHELVESSTENLWLSYDREADVLYVSMHRPDVADDTEYRDDGVIVRYRGDTVIGYTIPLFSERRPSSEAS
jgi:uncharacterized protein YuzE